MVSVAAIRAPIFVPADRPERFAKAAASGADAVILDLEDAVAPARKDAARTNLSTGFTDLPVVVRINGVGTTWHEADLAAVETLGVAAIIVPKAASVAEMQIVVSMLPGIPMVALVETALGLSAARAVAGIPGVVRLAFGSVDYCADLNCVHERDVLLPARLELVLASRLAGIAAPLDGVTTVLDDARVAGSDAAHARNLGMSGKMCIHPNQVAEVLRSFAPTETELAWARRVLSTDVGAAVVDGVMVDEPVRTRARAILEQSRSSSHYCGGCHT